MRVARLALFGALALGFVPAAQAQIETGFSVWTRIIESNSPSADIQGLSINTGPTFVVGYQAANWALGLATAYSRGQLKADDGSGNTSTETLSGWAVGPQAMWHFFQAPNGMTRGNVILEITYGKASLKDESGGSTSEIKGDIFGGRLGVGGDHFFSGNFGIGAEVGFEYQRLNNLKASSGGTTSPASADLTSMGAYGALRATVIL